VTSLTTRQVSKYGDEQQDFEDNANRAARLTSSSREAIAHAGCLR
jgi:hypothetical protein